MNKEIKKKLMAECWPKKENSSVNWHRPTPYEKWHKRMLDKILGRKGEV